MTLEVTLLAEVDAAAWVWGGLGLGLGCELGLGLEVAAATLVVAHPSLGRRADMQLVR